MLALKSLITLVGTAASLATSSYLGSSLSSKKEPQVSLTTTSTQETEEATVTPKSEEVIETVEETLAPAVTEISEVEVQEVTKPPVQTKEEVKEVIYISKVTLRREFAGIRRPGKPLTGAYELINNFFGKAEEIKSKDQGLWAEFVRDFGRSTDEDTLEAACKGYSNRDAASFINNQWLKGKIRDYCYVQIGFKL